MSNPYITTICLQSVSTEHVTTTLNDVFVQIWLLRPSTVKLLFDSDGKITNQITVQNHKSFEIKSKSFEPKSQITNQITMSTKWQQF